MPENVINGVSDEQAARVGEASRWSMLAMQFESAAEFCRRMSRYASIENPRTRAVMVATTGRDPDGCMEALMEDLGELRETPFGVVGGEGASDYISRAAQRKITEAEKRKITEAETYRQSLVTKANFGTGVESEQAYAELAKLGLDEDGKPEIKA